MTETAVLEGPDKRFLDVLIADQKECASILKADMESQCLRRVYCRAYLTVVEGGVFYIKSYTHHFNEELLRPLVNLVASWGIEFSSPVFTDPVPPEEAKLLLERIPEVGSNGAIRYGTRFLDFKTNFKFAIRMVDRVFKTSCSPDYKSISEWTKLLDAVSVRNRITHPKDSVSLEVTDSELQSITEGCQWFLDFVGDVLSKIGDAVQEAEESVAQVAKDTAHVSIGLLDILELIRSEGNASRDGH